MSKKRQFSRPPRAIWAFHGWWNTECWGRIDMKAGASLLGQDVVASLLSLCMAKWLRKWRRGWLYVRLNTKNAKSLISRNVKKRHNGSFSGGVTGNWRLIISVDLSTIYWKALKVVFMALDQSAMRISLRWRCVWLYMGNGKCKGRGWNKSYVIKFNLFEVNIF